MEIKQSRYGKLLDQSKDKRASHRSRTLKSGVIIFNNGYSSFACRIKNMSEQGAMLECDSTFSIPAEFDLRAAGASDSKPAKRVWCTETRLGVSLKSQ